LPFCFSLKKEKKVLAFSQVLRGEKFSTGGAETTTGKILTIGFSFNYRNGLKGLGRVRIQGISVRFSALQKRQNVRLSAHGGVRFSARDN
jgi:hypothetical protein